MRFFAKKQIPTERILQIRDAVYGELDGEFENIGVMKIHLSFLTAALEEVMDKTFMMDYNKESGHYIMKLE